MKQQSLAAAAGHGAGFEQYRRATKRDDVLQRLFADVFEAGPDSALHCAVHRV
jgi:hypothetical protein